MFKKPDEWVIPLKDKSIKELQDKEVVFTATFSRADQKAKWCFKGEEIFKGKQYKIEVLEDESGELTIHQLTIKKPMYKNMGKYTVTINEVQNDTGSEAATMDITDGGKGSKHSSRGVSPTPGHQHHQHRAGHQQHVAPVHPVPVPQVKLFWYFVIGF